jgi:hypothetical protein
VFNRTAWALEPGDTARNGVEVVNKLKTKKCPKLGRDRLSTSAPCPVPPNLVRGIFHAVAARPPQRLVRISPKVTTVRLGVDERENERSLGVEKDTTKSGVIVAPALPDK